MCRGHDAPVRRAPSKEQHCALSGLALKAVCAGAGHWVATDNPDGLFEILAPSFGAVPDLHMQRTSMASPAGSFV